MNPINPSNPSNPTNPINSTNRINPTAKKNWTNINDFGKLYTISFEP